MHQPISIRANWIWSGVGKPQANSCLTLHQDRIVSISSESPALALDLGSYCILPGLINSHTHLEFSDLEQPVPAGNSFADWILDVVQRRRMVAMANSIIDRSPTSRGLVESGADGVRLALDIVHASVDASNSNEPLPASAPHPQPLSPKTGTGEQVFGEKNSSLGFQTDSPYTPTTIRFAELMSTTELRTKQTWKAAFQLKKEAGLCSSSTFRFGLSPHAPYTTTSRQIRQAVMRCNRWQVPIMMHLAESIDELRWIGKGDGPLQDLLDRVAGPDALSTKNRLSMAGYLHELCQAPMAFVVHGNYLDDPSMAILEAHRDKAAVVYCPRTHAHFGHSTHPLLELRRRGIPVVLGTDSRASNPDLSIFEEARHVHQNFPEIPAAEIIGMIAMRPAELLGCAHDWGYVRSKSLAQLTAIPCHAKRSEDVLEELLTSSYRAQPLEIVAKSLRRL